MTVVGAAQAAPVLSWERRVDANTPSPTLSWERRIVTQDDNNGVVPGTVNVFGEEITNILNPGTVYGPGPNYTPTQFTGVGQLLLTQTGQPGAGLCTGSRIGPRQILTAAHCLTDDSNNLTADGGQVGFINENGQLEIYDIAPITSDNIHPLYDGVLLNGYDVAVLELVQKPGDNIETYSLYRGNDELSQEYTKVGFGGLGNGDVGARFNLRDNDNDGTPDTVVRELGYKLQGTNKYEATMSFINAIQGLIGAPLFGNQDTMLLSDFDNGLVANNAFQQADAFLQGFGIFVDGAGTFGDLGTQFEVNTAPGDSGGPGFIDGKIAGITSFGISYLTFFGELDGVLNSGFGEWSGDARVSAALAFIDEFTPVPVPAAVWMFATVLAAGGALRRKKVEA